MDTNISTEMQILWCAIALGLIQMLMAVLASVGSRGMPWALGPRDEPGAALSQTGARLERAYRNFLETFPFFAVAVLVADMLGKSTHNTVLGAQLYIWGRLLYVPAYVFAVPFLRTLLWTVALVGILLVMAAIWPGF
ncbi:MAG TPA: MAPEG family protein [Rhizomicrobium sp.]|jgi:uncharacterized MAPEG superfamily protein|nr:MAPEG family protein [Rhizomicrobium sp.]